MTPAALRPLGTDDTICVVAPAGPAPADRMGRGLEQLRRRHARIDVRYVAGAIGPQPYLAGDDDLRAGELARALADPDCGAVMCVRGGYGSARLLAALRPGVEDVLRRRRLPIVGFSDVTALHCWAARAGVWSVHGPVLTQLGDLGDDDVDALMALLAGVAPRPIGGLRSERDGIATGRLVGGNLVVLASLTGTPYAVDTRDAIVVLEDIGEAPYRLDRALTQLILAGAFDEARGVVIGDFTDCSSEALTALDVLRERLLPLGVPMVSGAPVGHGGRNRALVLGAKYTLDATAGTLGPAP